MNSTKPLTYRGREVDSLLGISKSTRYSWQNVNSPQYDPGWPVPIKLSARSTAYLVSEIETWLASRPRVRDINQHQAPETQKQQIATRCGRETAQKTQQQACTHWKSRPRAGIATRVAEE